MKKGLLLVMYVGYSFFATSQVVRVGLNGYGSIMNEPYSSIGLGSEITFAPKSNYDFGIYAKRGQFTFPGVGKSISPTSSSFIGILGRRFLPINKIVKPYFGMSFSKFENGIDIKSHYGPALILGLKLGIFNFNSSYLISKSKQNGMYFDMGFLFGIGIIKKEKTIKKEN